MKQYAFSNDCTYRCCILIKESSFVPAEIAKQYVQPLITLGVDVKDIYAMSLEYDKKTPSSLCMSNTTARVNAIFSNLKTEYVYCADSHYYKKWTGNTLTKSLKDVVEVEDYKLIAGINFEMLLHQSGAEEMLKHSIQHLAKQLNGGVVSQVSAALESAKIIRVYHYEDIVKWLTKLHQFPSLCIDIEAFSLRHYEAGIATISFAWNDHEAVSFPVDMREIDGVNARVVNTLVRNLLRDFFETYTGNIKAHNANYDFKVIIYNLWMKNHTDRAGMLKGIEIMTRDFDDTKVIAYLALNTTAILSLSLKELAYAHVGNYAIEVNNVLEIPLKDLLQYNAVDTIATWYVYKTLYPKMVEDQQLDLYQGLMKESVILLLQTELVGMPLDMKQVQYAKEYLEWVVKSSVSVVNSFSYVKQTEQLLREKEVEKANAKLKKLRKTVDDFADLSFMITSSQQLATLLFDVMHLPVINTTPTGQPSTDEDTITYLINHTDDPDKIAVLKAIKEFNKANKILSTFISAFEKYSYEYNGEYWLHGNFNIGGTISGRLSSSKPNLQNMPSGSKYGVLIKSCFKAPKGWVFCYADFNALEDRINTLLTKDPNKLKIFIDGYDAHSLRAYSFFPDAYRDVPYTLEGINGAVKTHKQWRDKAKAPHFAMQYGGTAYALQMQCGFSATEAAFVELQYKDLYKVSYAWTDAQIAFCQEHGYITLAFGLRLRTPLLARSVAGSQMGYKAKEEARSMGNAVGGQSWGLLNNRAAAACMRRVWASPFKEDIFCIALIHDASYFIVRNNVQAIEFLNRVLIEEMAWQEAPEIQHDQVKLLGALDVCYKGWHQKFELPNNASANEIKTLCRKYQQEYDQNPIALPTIPK